ncbi:MAG: hypothetical protein AAGB48_08465 [Planctomycetota bacterium]
MTPEVQEKILESLTINEVQVQIVQHDADGRSRMGARFAPSSGSVSLAPVYDMHELTELGDTVSIAIAIMRYLSERSSLIELSIAFGRLLEEHEVNEGPR